MNILLCIDVLPTNNSGMTIRIESIFRKLAENHKVHFVYIGNSKMGEETRKIVQAFSSSFDQIFLKSKQNLLGRIFNILLFKHGHYRKYRFKEDYNSVRTKLRQLIVDNKIDVVHVFGCFTAQYVQGFADVFRIWDIADSYSLDMRRKMNVAPLRAKFNLWLCQIRLYNYEKEIINDFDKIIFVSNIDANEYRRLKAKNKILVIPNGVDLEYFNRNNAIKEDQNCLVFTGHMSFTPNIEAAQYFVESILPLIKKVKPKVKFFIVGADAGEKVKSLNNDIDIFVTGRVDDIRLYLDKASVFVNPMITGCGIKNKVLQAMAMQKAIVSTTLGAESISIANGKDILLADKTEEFADKIIQILTDSALRARLGEEARKTVESNYSWERTLTGYEEIYNLSKSN